MLKMGSRLVLTQRQKSQVSDKSNMIIGYSWRLWNDRVTSFTSVRNLNDTLFADGEICFDVKISTVQHGSDSQWRLGNCESNGTEYQDFEMYLQRCCLKPGRHALTCKNNRNPYGWDEGYIEFLGHRYCDDFMSYTMMQMINVNGMISIIRMQQQFILI